MVLDTNVAMTDLSGNAFCVKDEINDSEGSHLSAKVVDSFMDLSMQCQGRDSFMDLFMQ